MKASILTIFFSFFLFANLFASNVKIQANKVSLDKESKTSIFEGDVVVNTQEKIIKSNYVKYDKTKGFLIIKNDVVATDNKNNIIRTNYAEYYEKEKIFQSIGPTTINTSEGYILDGSNIYIDNLKKIIRSDDKSIIIDQEKNQIFLDEFEYLIKDNIFKSVNNVKIIDNKNNNFDFSQIYIDTKKKEILGTDIKAFINDSSLKINERNKPRIFANNISLNKENKVFYKNNFTLCDYREKDKCPPWSIQSTKMLHDNKKKTIFYDNAIIKVYDIPIFYLPKLSHPDPSVDRRSGFLPPSLSDTKNLGENITIPYFFNVSKDKNFTLTNKLYVSENPLFYGEYNQALKNSFFMADFGFTEGYRNTSSTKKAGEKSHFFTKFNKNFSSENNYERNFNFSYQNVSDDKYLKLYKIKSNLVDYNTDVLESSLNFTSENSDTFFGIDTIMYETMKTNYEDKYEYIFPEVTLDKSLFNDEKFGSLDLQTNFKVRSYDTNKLENFFVNDFNWESKDLKSGTGINTNILGNFKNINYEAKNIDIYKEDVTSEFYGALGILSRLDLIKKYDNSDHFFSPKILMRFSPGSMRQMSSGSRLNPESAFELNRINDTNNFETGISSTVGFDYKIEKSNKEFDFSLAQVINEKENNKKADITSLNEKLSDLVGSMKIDINENTSFKYDFSVDQNYSDINYNELGISSLMGPMNVNLSYLQENKHIGDQEYINAKINFNNKENREISLETKRNLITNSSEFYNLSYEYINDCLRAGLVYRREFYNDSELEPENSLMFKITLVPFGQIDSPTFSN